MASKYDCYVHEANGTYYVGYYDKERSQYLWPLSALVQRKSGCTSAFSRTIAGFGGSYWYRNRKSALNRARLVYGPREDD